MWLEDMPIATLRPTGSGTPTPIAIHYVHADHLGAPRAVTRPSDSAILWRWDNAEPFGNNAADENPAGQGTFKYNLRFPGQYYDAETGTHYNYFRDYDSAIGRYEQSDPIGLSGGLNTYTYVGGSPIKFSDPMGQDHWGDDLTLKAPPLICRYYDVQCRNANCQGGDKYACAAKKCCEAFGDNPKSNCTRKCLIDNDFDCSSLPPDERNKCRFRNHVKCYWDCKNVGDTVRLPWIIPSACADAMNGMGGFFGGYWPF